MAGKGGKGKKIIIAVVVVLVIIIGIAGSGSNDEPKFNEEELIGMTVLEARPILEESGYGLTVLSQTGADMNNDLSSIPDWQLEQLYVYKCDADHGADTVKIVVITQNSEFFAEIS